MARKSPQTFSCVLGRVLLGYFLARAIGSGVEHFLHTEGVAGSNPASPTSGDIAQLGERVTGSHEVRGSNPLISTKMALELSGFSPGGSFFLPNPFEGYRTKRVSDIAPYPQVDTSRSGPGIGSRQLPAWTKRASGLPHSPS